MIRVSAFHAVQTEGLGFGFFAKLARECRFSCKMWDASFGNTSVVGSLGSLYGLEP